MKPPGLAGTGLGRWPFWGGSLFTGSSVDGQVSCSIIHCSHSRPWQPTRLVCVRLVLGIHIQIISRPFHELLEGRVEKAMAPHSSTLAWKIPWTEDLVGCSPWGH